MTGWSWLLLAGVLEIGFATALKLEQQDARFGLLFLVCAVLSFECLARALRQIPLSTAYAIWTGIGSIGAVAAGALLFGESLSPVRLLLLGLLIAALAGLKLATPREQKTNTPD